MSSNLDQVDRRILYELERNARIPDVKLAKIVGKSKDAVRYRIKKLEDSGILTKYIPWVDLAKLGYRTATVYLTLLNLPEQKTQLIEDVRHDPRAYWLGVAEGVWNIGITYFIRSNEDLFEIKSDLLTRYGNLITNITTTAFVSVSVHEKSFLADLPSSLLTFSEHVEFFELDAVSKLILRELYRDSRANIAKISLICKTTPDIVKARMNKLEEQRIIVRYTVGLDYQRLGYELYKAFVYLKNSQELKAIYAYAQQSKHIINVVKQIAPWELELIIFARSFSEYNTVIGEFTSKFSLTVKKIETAVMSEDTIFPCQKLVFE